MPDLLSPTSPLPLIVATQTCGYGFGWWLSEWAWQPGNDATDKIVMVAFGANFLVLLALLAKAMFGTEARRA